MTKPIVQVDGAKRLRRELKRAGVDLADLRKPNMEAARIVSTASQPRAPRRTGALAGSTRPGASRTSGTIRAGGARVPYANVIHWGWPAHNIKANPWLAETAAATEPVWVDAYWQMLDDVLDNLAGR